MHFYRGSGAGAAAYFEEGHHQVEAYYTQDAQITATIDTWRDGKRAATTDLARSGDLIAWVEGIDPATGEVKGTIRKGGPDRQPLRFVEMTVNNPKSLSVVASQNPAIAQVLDQVMARQADEVARYLSKVAVTRIGPRGAQAEVSGLTLQTARVTHLTSREGDPHRHIHLMTNTRVKVPDATWCGLHSVALRQHIAAINALGARVAQGDPDLRVALAAQGYSLGTDGEIDQARSATQLMSKRGAQIAANRDRAEATWRARYPGREPSRRTMAGWDKAAWEHERRAKPDNPETPEEVAERVRLELAEAGWDFTPGARQPIAWQAMSIAQVDREAVAIEAVAVLSARKSAWSVAELSAQVQSAVTRTGVVGDPQAVTELAEDIEARARARCVTLLDPDQVPTAMSKYLSSAQVLDADRDLNLGLVGLVGPALEETQQRLSSQLVRAAQAQGLDAGQAQAVAALGGSRHLEVVIGPAGAGKTAMLGAARQALESQGRDMVIVAPTRKAALVAGAEVGTQASSLSKLLHQHGWRWDELGTWSHLQPGQVDATGYQYTGPDPAAQLSDRSVVVVDEAGLTTVDQANALVGLCAQSGAALRLVGDPRQLGAVGRGGVMETASRWVAPTVLDEIHRFLALGTDPDGLPTMEADRQYAELTLALREGTDPDQVAAELVERGSVVIHPTPSQAIEAIATQIAAQVDTPGALAATVATNEQAGAINAAVRDLRIRAGTVDDSRVLAGMDQVRIGVGDHIVTRSNDAANDVSNRQSWTVAAINPDGSLLAGSALADRGQRQVLLEPAYVSRAVQLGYATTDYGNQGTTTERSLTWVADATTAGGLYVGATRGRYDNTLHVVANDLDQAADRIVAAMGRDRADRGLDVARDQAEGESTPAPERPHTPDRPGPGQIDLSRWRTEAELATYATTLAQLQARLAQFQDVPVMSEEAYQRANATDQAARAANREAAQRHRDEAARLRARGGELTGQIEADFFDAREAARIIEAGPGILRRRAAQVLTAQALRDEIAQRWPTTALPGSDWSDRLVGHCAVNLAQAMVNDAARHHSEEAHRADQAGASYRQRLEARQHNQLQGRLNASRRAEALALAEDQRVDLGALRQYRQEHTVHMAPEQITAVDQARTRRAKEIEEMTRASERRLAASREPYRSPSRSGPDPGRHREGPGIGM